MQKKILLVEPDYKNKYPPMGLMKISTYHKLLGDDVFFYKGKPIDFVLNEMALDLIKVLTNIQPQIDWIGKKQKLIVLIKRGATARNFADLDIENLPPLATTVIKEYSANFKRKSYFKNPQWDRICITTLFTFYWQKTIDTINFFKKLCKDPNEVKVGGIASSVDPIALEEETGIKPHIGLLDKGGEYDDNNIIIDRLPLDYSILDEIDYEYPVHDGYYAYTTRGCVNHCPFCVVPEIEPNYICYIPLKENINYTNTHFGEKKNLLLLDNNVLASKDFFSIIDEIKESGFSKGSVFSSPNSYSIAVKEIRDGVNIRGNVRLVFKLYKQLPQKLSSNEKDQIWEIYKKYNLLNLDYANATTVLELDHLFSPLFQKHHKKNKVKRYVDFNQGVDARLVTEEKMAKLSEIAIRPLRIAFDNWNLKSIYEKAIRLAAKYGIKSLSNYLLYNFQDYPIDLYKRMKFNIDLGMELGVTIFSFPMKYHPVSDSRYFRNRNYIGIHWNKKYIRTIQIILNATKGKVSPHPDFFYEAFGHNENEFAQLLIMPESMIFNRNYYKLNGMRDEWWQSYQNLAQSQKQTVNSIIFTNKFPPSKDPDIEDVLSYYRIKTNCKAKPV